MSKSLNGNRWMVVVVILALLGGFTSAYGFFHSNFVSRIEHESTYGDIRSRLERIENLLLQRSR